MTEPSGIARPLSARLWTIGNPDSPTLWWNAVDPYGVEWVIRDPQGWYESPPVELGLEDRPLDGAWFGRGAYKARVVEIEGAFRMCRGGQDELDEIRERLQAAFDPTVDTLLAVNERIPKQLTVRPSSEVAAHPVKGQRRAGIFSVVLTAADPFKYAAGAAGQETTILFLLDPTAMGGLTHDLEHPLDHGGVDLDALGWQKTVTNIGSVPALPIVRFVGPASRPTLTNATTGEVFTLDRDLPAGVEAVIDMEMRTVIVGGASDFAAKAPRSSFWALAKGANVVRFTADAFNPAARAYLTLRPRWK